MPLPKLLPILSLLIIPLFLTGCGKTVSDRVAEKMVENLSNGQVKVDINNKETKVETEYGTGKVGENVGVPSDFPTDVYVIEGVVKTSYKNAGQNGWTISVETSKSPTEAKTLYEQKLKDSGWTINSMLDMGTAITLGGVKGNRTVSVMISTDDSGKTTVIVGTSSR